MGMQLALHRRGRESRNGKPPTTKQGQRLPTSCRSGHLPQSQAKFEGLPSTTCLKRKQSTSVRSCAKLQGQPWAVLKPESGERRVLWTDLTSHGGIYETNTSVR